MTIKERLSNRRYVKPKYDKEGNTYAGNAAGFCDFCPQGETTEDAQSWISCIECTAGKYSGLAQTGISSKGVKTVWNEQ